MKTLLIIIGFAAASVLTQKIKAEQKMKITSTVSPACIDSTMEAGRIERMRNKLL
jgi:hypothetical protein